jgi:hypothetical protein
MKQLIPAIAVLASLVASPAAADMYGFPNGGYTPTQEQRQMQERAIGMKQTVRSCDGMRQSLVRYTNAKINQVYANSYDMADRGWVQHNSREIFMRDVKEEIVRAEEEFRQLSYANNLSESDCQMTYRKYIGYVDCYFNNTMNNEPIKNRQCSDLYRIYVNPDKYYPPN